LSVTKGDADSGGEVPNDDIVKWYELDKGQYIEEGGAVGTDAHSSQAVPRFFDDLL
jgi:hypothetical protein